MRQGKKEIRDRKTILGLLNNSSIGRLATNGKDGYPVIKPLNYVFIDEKIYFHSAKEGEKIDDIKRDDRVCFEVDLPIALVKSRSEPCRAEYLFRSLIIKGKASIVENEDERIAALKGLMRKYQPEGGYGEFPEEKLKITAVVRIDILEMTGKEDLGKDRIREAAERALTENAALPVALERK